jgi:carboxylesterase type B
MTFNLSRRASTAGACRFLPAWPRYDTARRATMVLDAECRVVDDPDSDVRRLWATV